MGVEHGEELVEETVDRENRRVVLLDRVWKEKILRIHPEMESFRTDVLRTVEAPDCLEADRRPHRVRYFSKGLGPTAWLLVVVSYEQEPARIVTAFARRKDPSGWSLRT
jgi:hypothetical protein